MAHLRRKLKDLDIGPCQSALLADHQAMSRLTLDRILSLPFALAIAALEQASLLLCTLAGGALGQLQRIWPSKVAD